MSGQAANDEMSAIDNYFLSDPMQIFWPTLLHDDVLLNDILDMEMASGEQPPPDKETESARKTRFLMDSDDKDDGDAWSTKRIEDWSQGDTINWLMSAASHMGQSYCSIQQTLAMPGKELLTLTKKDFIFHDQDYGEKLYDHLHSQMMLNILPNFSSLRKILKHGRRSSGSTTVSEITESEDSLDESPRRQRPGRTTGLKQKKQSNNLGKLWEFIRDLLQNPETCPSLIRWEDYSKAKFKFIRGEEVAKRWGARNGNTNMTYEKMSRAMRYHYTNKVFQSVKKDNLVYQFGPNATGWQTDNPNFSRKSSST
ncbi:ETS homologous factor-like isoform X2 [Diachasmimorpha longicaudata]|uniref:ETS homologous factor-like isoform X2 n=1 Tax=Diachasmimorpha longicaudata TaxID=58733 RepID=UPI0030B917AB